MYCRNLRDTDVFSKSDPICIVHHRPFGSKNWAEFKRTECIDNTLNPNFATKIPITYHFEEQQHLKFVLYDIDSGSHNLADHDFLGEYECTLAQLVSCRKIEKPLLENGRGGRNGTIIIVAEELSSCKEELVVQLVGRRLENTSWFCSLHPFLEFYKSNEDNSYTLVHRTDPVRGTRDPVWREFSVPLRTFCSGDYDRNIKVICKSFKTNGSHKTIGVFYTTVSKLVEGHGTFWVINEDRKVCHEI